MKKQLIASVVLLIVLLDTRHCLAQLTIANGAQFVITGNLPIALSDADLVNNGSLSPGSGTISFTGSSTSFIKGSQSSHFYILGINKTAGGKLTLQNPISVDGQINFTSGLLDLDGVDANLGTTGRLNGENASNHIIGANGGTVIVTTTLNAPAAANPGNLGLLLTSTQNLGNTVIRRGQASQTDVPGNGASILRYYDIQPANNTVLNATLRFTYMNSELNGLDENSLTLWEKRGAGGWTSLGEDSRDTVANYVEKSGIASLGSFTLSAAPAPLPIRFIFFGTQCNGSSVVLSWKTAQEQNSHYYSVERSADAVQWITLGNVPAAGNSTVETDYTFTDNSPAGNDYYRIAEYDMDGKEQLTDVKHTTCSIPPIFKIWPNPVDDRLYISMTAAAGEDVIIKLFDGKGALVRLQKATLVDGNNLLSVDVKGLAAGVYHAAVISNKRQLPTKEVIKR